MENVERKYFATADAIGTAPVEAYSLEAQKNRLQVSANTNLTDMVKEAINDVPNLLPFAADVYRISANIKDYIFAPVISLGSDLCNRNQQCFTFKELTRFNPSAGTVMFKTWCGKPTFQEHVNGDYTKAKGIIMACVMRPIANTEGNLFKIIKLLAFDRNRDPVLANAILTGERRSYSMGAMAADYECSFCGASLNRGGCDHVEYNKPNFKLFEDNDGKRRLAYHNIIDAVGFECSSVANPAYASAVDVNHFTLD